MHELVVQPTIERRPLQERSIFSDNGANISRKTSAIVQPVQKENQSINTLFMSPILPGTSSVTHNVTRFLSNKEGSDGLEMPEIPSFQSGYRSTTAKELFVTPKGNNVSSTSEDDNIDVGNDSSDLILTCDGPSLTDSSMSTRGSTSPPSTDGKPSPNSSISSPGSGCGSVNSPEQEGPPVRKKARTNYTPGQVKALERQFHENPYPDAEMMETLSQNLQIPENKLKIWFQNKRARWRRRVNDNMNMNNNPFNALMSMSPVLPQMTPYGMVQASPFMTSSPTQGLPAFFNYQGQISPNNNHQTNQNNQRLQPPNQMFGNNQATSQGIRPAVPTSSHCLLTSPSPYISHNYRHLQYPPYLYQNLGAYSPKS